MCTLSDDWMTAKPNPNVRPELNAWVAQHNRAVREYRRFRIGAMSDLRTPERAILELAAGIEFYVTLSIKDDAADPWGGEYIVHELLTGFNNALNLDLGRLHAGTLNLWGERTRERYGIDAEGQWVGGA